MLRTQNDGNPKRLVAARALLGPAAESDANASILAAVRGGRAFLKHGRPNLPRSSSVPVSLNRRTCSMKPIAVKGPFFSLHILLNSEFMLGNGRLLLIQVKQLHQLSFILCTQHLCSRTQFTTVKWLQVISAGSYNKLICIFPPYSPVQAPLIGFYLVFFPS